ncbi:hypothetical protein NIES39_J05610 [Arthrospira platensis NIES-39]|nr:hypothetical protein NIES39_J05610 [Arthrospira platensis NIES-39]
MGFFTNPELGWAQPANTTNRLAGETAFDIAIQEVGGIRRGQVSYLEFSEQFNPSLDRAIRERFQQFIDRSHSTITYSYAEFDLNGDGRNEVFVKVNSSFAAGSGGVHTLLFQLSQNNYELIHVFFHQLSLVVLPGQTSGWRDIFVVPGKILNPNSGVSYSLCYHNFNLENSSRRVDLTPVDNSNYLKSLNRYDNCQSVPQNYTVNGIVIHTGGFNVQYPEFEL